MESISEKNDADDLHDAVENGEVWGQLLVFPLVRLGAVGQQQLRDFVLADAGTDSHGIGERSVLPSAAPRCHTSKIKTLNPFHHLSSAFGSAFFESRKTTASLWPSETAT